jgi:isoamylase
MMLMPHVHPALQFTYPLTYGAVLLDGGVQFRIFSRSATELRVLLYDHVDDPEPVEVIRFDRDNDRWGDIWSIFVPGIDAGQLYHVQADGPWDPERGQRFNGKARLIDPYAKALAGDFLSSKDGVIRPPKCVVVDDLFDWAGDRHLRRPLADTVIYEMHVRGFTQHPSSRVEHPGTYLGVIEKIPYLKSLGVTAVELMPVHDFPNKAPGANAQVVPSNYWGYDPLAFFAPHRGYAAGDTPGCQVNEFKQMVRALHAAGIEVILDVVFNHTCEGNELGPTLSFKGLENRVYYMLANNGSKYRNYSGCGNTINGNHPIVREMIFHCLRHWVHNYHIDGFRFDLASILSRGRNGELLPSPPLVEMIAEDPMLADTKVIAEAWDAAGAYQVGSFANLRWAEWNGRYRDDARRYWRGDGGTRKDMATRLAGSSDLYESSSRQPYHSINFITSHDGFTLNDLVSYTDKHNEANGEGNRDGDNNNISANYGVEGPTDRREIATVRLRQLKNMLSTLLLSQGVPMIVSGDECRRTQRGNNNAYCQDNEVSWFDWTLVDRNADLMRFVREVIAFRRGQPGLRRKRFLSSKPRRPGMLPDASWFDADGNDVDWDSGDVSLQLLLGAPADAGIDQDVARHVLIMMHSGTLPRRFTFPTAARRMDWRLLIDTSALSPADFYADGTGPRPPMTGQVTLAERTLMVFVARPAWPITGAAKPGGIEIVDDA